MTRTAENGKYKRLFTCLHPSLPKERQSYGAIMSAPVPVSF